MTIPVLTEAFHLLTPGSIGAERLMDFIAGGGLAVWHLDDASLSRTFELMIRYSDQPSSAATGTTTSNSSGRYAEVHRPGCAK